MQTVVYDYNVVVLVDHPGRGFIRHYTAELTHATRVHLMCFMKRLTFL